MIKRTTKLRWRRHIRNRKRQVEDIGLQAEEQLDRHLIRRIGRLVEVRRFIVSWLALFVLLIGGVVVQTRALGRYYQDLQPAPGGTYTEGIVGAFTNANPLYATGLVDTSVSQLLFSGLFRYNSSNQLVGDLAQKWEVNDDGKVYTVSLKPELQWHDGRPLTAADVVFTYETIKNPDAKSPLASGWQGIEIKAAGEHTVTFTLPTSLTSFPYSLTNGIVPKHLLENVPAAQLRSIAFNTVGPVGSGPFRWKTIEVTGETPEEREEIVAMVANEVYHNGRPRLDQIVIRAFRDEDKLIESFVNKQLNAVVGVDSVPDTAVDNPNLIQHDVPLTGAVMVFFKTNHEYLKDSKVRQALARATNTLEIVKGLDYPAIIAKGPLLMGQLGFDKNLTQFTQNLEEANKLLDEAGWKLGDDGIRAKDGKPLTFQLYSQSNSEYAYVTGRLQQYWRTIGVDVEVLLQPDEEFQETLTYHSYDAVLYAISIGADPDVFAYWHSTQGDVLSQNRLNFSEYSSKPADDALEAGRTRSDEALRALKYRPFLEAWRNDVPAIALYQPRFLYLTHGEVFGLDLRVVNSAKDRFANVENWMVRQERALK